MTFPQWANALDAVASYALAAWITWLLLKR